MKYMYADTSCSNVANTRKNPALLLYSNSREDDDNYDYISDRDKFSLLQVSLSQQLLGQVGRLRLGQACLIPGIGRLGLVKAP